MLGEEYYGEDQDVQVEERAERIVPDFSIDLMESLEWIGPIFDEGLVRWVFVAQLIFSSNNEPVVVDIKDSSHKSCLTEFTTNCASYYRDYRTVVRQDGSVHMLHILPKGIKKIRQPAAEE